MAQLDARSTGDEVVGSIPTRSLEIDQEMFFSAILFLPPYSRRAVISFWVKNVHTRSLEIDQEMFFSAILFLPPYSRRAVISFWVKNVHKYWLTALRTKPTQKKRVFKVN